MPETDLKESTFSDDVKKKGSTSKMQEAPVSTDVKWKNPTRQKIEVILKGCAISFLPGEVKSFNEDVFFGQNTRLIKI